MAERIADDADLAVDELKRRARRRLVGAIVLALAAAVILPLLLEKEPKPLGDDVSVQIPPVDEGRFINRLTGRSTDAKSAAKSDTRPLPKSAPTKVDAPPPPTGNVATAAAPAQSSAAPPTGVVQPEKSAAETEPKTPAIGAKAAPAPKLDAPAAAVASAPPSAAAPASTAAPTSPAPDAAAARAEGFAVQIAAFTDDKGANALAGKLKKAGYATTYTEPVETSRGTLWRVRVGGFGSRPDADAARAKLKADGWSGIVVSAK